MTAKVGIGSKYEKPVSLFSQRTGAGSFQQTLAPMTRDEELVQEALIGSAPRVKKVGELKKGYFDKVAVVAAGVVVSGLVMLALFG